MSDESTLRKLQLCQLQIIKDVDHICRQNGLKYFMVGGTLLGAVRHGGFIPWDDDLDIAMFREDYEKFQKIMIEQHSEKYFLQNSATDRNYPRVIAKVRLNGTIQLERSYEKVDSHCGIYIDIFPIDYVNKTGGVGLELRGKIVRLCFAYKTLQAGSNNRHNMKLKRVLKFIPFIIPPSCIDRLMKYACTRTNKAHGKFCTIFLSGYGWKRQLRETRVFGSGKYIPFEDTSLCGPDDADAFLTKLFGHYMELPPVEKRVAHKLIKIDFGEYDPILTEQYKGEKLVGKADNK